MHCRQTIFYGAFISPVHLTVAVSIAVSIAVIAGISVSIISTAGVVLVVPVAVTGITLPVIIGMEIIVQ